MVEPNEDSTDPIGDEPGETLIEFTMDGGGGDAEDHEVDPGSSKEQFLTTEELQTLGDVLGHVSESSESSEEHEEESRGAPPSDPGSGQTQLGDPAGFFEERKEDAPVARLLDLSTVETQLTGLQTTMDELRANSWDTNALQPLLAEIKSEVEIGHHRRDILTSSLSSLSGDMHEMRLQLSATTKSAMESAVSLKGMRQQMTQQRGVGAIAHSRDLAWPILLVGFGLLPVSWALAFYLKTGDLRLTLGGLVAANLVSCAAILASRTRKLH